MKRRGLQEPFAAFGNPLARDEAAGDAIRHGVATKTPPPLNGGAPQRRQLDFGGAV